MRFKKFGSKENKTIILIHGFGVSWSMWKSHIETLCKDYYVVIPVLDGHDEESDSTFISAEKTAEPIIQYIKENCQGRVFAICGVSLGGIVAVHILAKKQDIAQKAIIDGAPLVPYSKVLKKIAIWYRLKETRLISKGGRLTKYVYKHTYLSDFIIKDMIKTCSNMSKETCINTTILACTSTIPDSIKTTEADVVYWYGSKEAIFTKKSADRIVQMIPNAKKEVFKKYGHGEFCMANPNLYTQKVTEFLNS